jgi:hypothetical protein
MQLFVGGEAGAPEGFEEAVVGPFEEAAVNRGRAAEAARYRLPLAAGAQHIEDPGENQPVVGPLAATARLAGISLRGIALRRGDQRLSLGPEGVGQHPGLAEHQHLHR